MAKTISYAKLDEAVSKILTEYSDQINTNMGIVISKVCGQGAKALRSESAAKFNGHDYAKNWKYKTETGRLYSEGTIYNQLYMMPHLLEFGHALLSGGRKIGQVPGRAHIATVADRLVTDFEKEVQKYL